MESMKSTLNRPTPVGGKISMPSFTTAVYHAKNGSQYNLCVENGSSLDNAYFGGQMADCIALGALSVENLDVIPNFYAEDIKFKGDYLIVCYSDKFPTGSRILASVYGSPEKIQDEWTRMKNLVLKGSGDLNFYNNMAKLTLNSGKENMWRMWLALAVANDVQKG